MALYGRRPSWTRLQCVWTSAIIVAASADAPPATAAMRTCFASLTATGSDPTSDVKAKANALAAWVAAAGRHGPAFTAWRISLDRSLTCQPQASSKAPFVCEARAKPCGISQTPGRLPPATVVPPPPDAPLKKNEQRTERAVRLRA
jgi:hypothetical protein